MDDEQRKLCVEHSLRIDQVEKLIKTEGEKTSQVLDLLRGGKNSLSSGLVGRVNEHESRLNTISKVFKALWTSIAAIATALVVKFFGK